MSALLSVGKCLKKDLKIILGFAKCCRPSSVTSYAILSYYIYNAITIPLRYSIYHQFNVDAYKCVFIYVCVSVSERERERERELFH